MRRHVVVLAVLAGVALIVGWVVAVRSGLLLSAGSDGPVLASVAVVALLVAALVAEGRRPGNPVSLAAVVLAAAVPLGLLRLASYPLLASIGALAWLGTVLVPIQIATAHPHGFSNRTRRVVIATCSILPLILGAAIVATSGPEELIVGDAVRPATWADADTVIQTRNPLVLFESPTAVRVLWVAWSTLVVGAVVVAVVTLVRRWARADRYERRVIGPVTAAGIVVAVVQLVQPIAARPEGLVIGEGQLLREWYGTAVVLLPLLSVVLLAGTLVHVELVRPRLARTRGGGLRLESSGVEDAERLELWLASMLDDPSLRLGFHDAETGGFVDRHGRSITPAAKDRGATVVERDGSPVAVLDHDLALVARPDDVDVAATMAGLALENERLHTISRLRVTAAEASAARLLTAADEARASVDERLRQGTLRTLTEVDAVLAGDGSPASALDAAHDGLRRAVGELREIAHGLHPAVLQEEGLLAALEDLPVSGRPLVVASAPAQRLPAAIELTLYLVVAEAARSGGTGMLEAYVDAGEAATVRVEGWTGPLSQHLRDRVATLGGAATVDGTSCRVALPLEGAAP